ncbi:MAG: Hpt domain-containing protein, partial [Planctomycetia bacterium]|nr:Hpt domain-containing protein [Planctomycetia bacterium]
MQVDLAEFRAIFFDEAADHLEVLDEISRALVAAPQDFDLVNRLFRSVHSVKGAATSFGVESVAEFAHHIENCLEQVRSGQVVATIEIAQQILRAVELLDGAIEAAKNDLPLPVEAGGFIGELRTIGTTEAFLTPNDVVKRTVSEVPFSADQDLLRDFLNEATEHLDIAEQVLL